MGKVGHKATCRRLSSKRRRGNTQSLAATLVIGLSLVFSVSLARASLLRNRARIEYQPREINPALLAEFVSAASAQVSSDPAHGASSGRVAATVGQPPLTELGTDLEPLRSDFNRNVSSTRLLLILSQS
jgi:hypothetical protein